LTRQVFALAGPYWSVAKNKARLKGFYPKQILKMRHELHITPPANGATSWRFFAWRSVEDRDEMDRIEAIGRRPE
jgi:hypothetical protein